MPFCGFHFLSHCQMGRNSVWNCLARPGLSQSVLPFRGPCKSRVELCSKSRQGKVLGCPNRKCYFLSMSSGKQPKYQVLSVIQLLSFGCWGCWVFHTIRKGSHFSVPYFGLVKVDWSVNGFPHAMRYPETALALLEVSPASDGMIAARKSLT